MNARRRIASNRVWLDGKPLGLYAVETVGNEVERFYPLMEELPFTEWVQGEVFLHTRDDGKVEFSDVASKT